MFFKSTKSREGYIDLDFYQSNNELNVISVNNLDDNTMKSLSNSSSIISIDAIPVENTKTKCLPKQQQKVQRQRHIEKSAKIMEKDKDYNNDMSTEENRNDFRKCKRDSEIFELQFVRHSKMPQFRLFCYILFYIFFLGVGGFTFHLIEAPVELLLEKSVHNLRNEFLWKHNQINDADLEEFLQAIIVANDRGISPLRNASNEMNWSFGQAFFFSSTVITTIGYGRVTPLSQTGKIFCIIYAIIGIPLTLVLLSAMIERLLIPANWLLITLNSKLGHLYQPFHIRIMHLTIIVLLEAVLFLIVPTLLFAYLEESWGFLDAFYYCFISLTTIGLGDYIPGEGVSVEHRSLYKMIITAYLILGLVAMMFVLTIFYDIPQLNLGQLFTEKTNNGETEKLRISNNNATCYSGSSNKYTQQRDEELQQRAVVRIRPHFGDDTPSPDEDHCPEALRMP